MQSFITAPLKNLFTSSNTSVNIFLNFLTCKGYKEFIEPTFKFGETQYPGIEKIIWNPFTHAEIPFHFRKYITHFNPLRGLVVVVNAEKLWADSKVFFRERVGDEELNKLKVKVATQ